MNKAELAAAVASEMDTTKAQAEAFIGAIQRHIKAAVKKGEEVRIAGLFNLSITAKPARTAKNPTTGAAVHVPAKNAIKIKAAKELCDAANPKG